MTGSWALDTNVLIAVLKDEPTAVQHWDEAEHVLVPATVLGEALFGMRNSGRAEQNEARLWDAIRWTRVIPVDSTVCARYADLKLHLKRAGTPIPEADLWITACCLAEAVPLASRDAHFDDVPGLRRDEWR